MAGSDDGPRAKPGQDPYEIEWPDDAKEMRAAERAKAAERANVRPVPRYFAAVVIGLAVVLAFIAPVALVLGQISILVIAAAPVVIVGVVAGFPIGAMLDRVSRTWRTGLPEIAFLTVGLAVGAGWTYAVLTLFQESLFDDAGEAAWVRSVTAIFMGTATASAFMAAKFWADPLRMHPRWVYGIGLGVAVLTVLSLFTIFSPAAA